MLSKNTMRLRVEELTQEQISKASDRDLTMLRLKFMQLWKKHFSKCDAVVVGSLNRDILMSKYRMLLKEMCGRELEHSTEPIDREAFKKAMEIRKAGLDVSQFSTIIVQEAAIFVKNLEDDEIEVIINSNSDEPDEALEEVIAKMLGEQLNKPCLFVYTQDVSGEVIPLFTEVLRPVSKIEKVEIQSRDSSKELGEKKFEREVPVIPVLEKAKQDEQIVYGIVYEPDTEDSQGDEASAEEIRKAAYQFMEECQTFKVMHKGRNVKVRILENYIAPVDFKIEGQSVKKGSWVLVTRILDKKLWKAIKKGKLTGWSMAGYARQA